MTLHFVFLVILVRISSGNHFVDNLEWNECEWFNPDNPYYDNVQCTDVMVPYSYLESSDLGTFSYRITRFVPSKIKCDPTIKTTNLFWLSGGPQHSGAFSLGWLGMKQLDSTSYIWYFPDHRGVGYSHPMECGDLDASNIGECIPLLMQSFGPQIYFSMTLDNAAHDVAYLLNEYFYDTDGEEVFIGGTSYGTLWLDRILLLYPELSINGAIYDSILHPQTEVVHSDRAHGDTAMSYLSLCELSVDCSKYFGRKGVKQTFYDFYDALDAGNHFCVHNVSNTFFAGWDKNTFRGFFVALLDGSWNHNQHYLIPAFLYRLNRCNDDDIMALNNVMSSLQSQRTKLFEDIPERLIFNPFINFFVSISENAFGPNTMWPDDINMDEFIKWNEYAIFTESLSMLIVSVLNDDVLQSLYTPNPNTWKTLSSSDHFRLILHGNLDYGTSYVESTTLFTDRPNWYYVLFPLHGHSVLSKAHDTIRRDVCPWKILKKFLKHPSRKPSTRCLEGYPSQFDWSASSQIAKDASESFFGTDDPWN
eukprot:45985_1